MKIVTLKNLVEYCYSKLLLGYSSGKKPIIYLAAYLIWEKLFKKYDPEIDVKIGKRFLFMNLSHQLPVYYYKYPNYDRALPRICKKLKEIDKRLFVIDVGANIGDTVSLISDVSKGNFLCVEGDEKYLPMLDKNVKRLNANNRIKIERCYCGPETKEKVFVTRAGGTAKIVKRKIPSIKGIVLRTLKMKTLDRIVEENPNFKNSNLLKIDTDGFENYVLNSGQAFIKKTKPLLYFEFTPGLYIQNNHKRNEIWNLLRRCGYKEALFYDNLGRAVEIVNIKNQIKLNELVAKIDNDNIDYYDVLAYQADNNKYSGILKAELNLFEKNKKYKIA